MKNIKKFLLITAMTMALGTSAFAASGFEFILNVPLGLGIGIPTKTEKDTYKQLSVKSGVGFDGGVTAQLGYMFQVVDGFGISVLGELGYAHTTRSGSAKGETEGVKVSASSTYSFDSFQIGLLPKFNIGAFAIGIGGGVKIPLAGELSMTTTIAVSDATTREELETKDNIALKRQDITDLFSPSVIGYMKVTFDYYLFFTDNIAMNFGLYLGGDFGPKMKEVKIGGDSFDIGLQLGFRFGPKA